MYSYTHIHIPTYRCTQIHIHIHKQIHIYTCRCICTHVHMYTYTHTHVWILQTLAAFTWSMREESGWKMYIEYCHKESRRRCDSTCGCVEFFSPEIRYKEVWVHIRNRFLSRSIQISTCVSIIPLILKWQIVCIRLWDSIFWWRLEPGVCWCGILGVGFWVGMGWDGADLRVKFLETMWRLELWALIEYSGMHLSLSRLLCFTKSAWLYIPSILWLFT